MFQFLDCWQCLLQATGLPKKQPKQHQKSNYKRRLRRKFHLCNCNLFMPFRWQFWECFVTFLSPSFKLSFCCHALWDFLCSTQIYKTPLTIHKPFNFGILLFMWCFTKFCMNSNHQTIFHIIHHKFYNFPRNTRYSLNKSPLSIQKINLTKICY